MHRKLTRTQYWQRMGIVATEIVIIAAFIVFVWPSLASSWQLDTDARDAISQMIIIINAVLAAPLLLVWLSQRARDIGNAHLWSFIGVVVPCGLIIVGCIPAHK